MANSSVDFMKDVLAAPLGELITSVGEGVAQAQAALDEGSLEQTLRIYSETDDEGLKLLRDIGYQPTFYALPETVCEAKISLAMSNVVTDGGKKTVSPLTGKLASPLKSKVYVSPVNATSSNKYNMKTEASTSLKFKIVPIPPSNSVAEIRVLPNLVGKDLSEVEELLSALGLTYTVDGTEDPAPEDAVMTQVPAFIVDKTQYLKVGDNIELTF